VEKTKPAAFFDLDRTLIEENSGKLYIQHERKHGRLSLGQVAISGFYLLMYHFSLVDIEKAYRKAAQHYTGQEDSMLRERTQTWFADEIQDLLLPGAKVALARHQEAGHPRVLLTSSSSYMSETVIEAWGLDDWLANHFSIDDDGLLTGEVSSPLCYGKGKVYWAEKWAERNGVDLDQSYFYTDSYSDMPMLERVEHPCVVNPDPRLRREAHIRKWPIFNWKNEEGATGF